MYALVFGVTFLKRFVQEVTTKHFRGYLYAFERNAEVKISLCVVIFVKLHFSTKKKKKKTWTCSKKSEVLSCGIVMMYNFIDMRSAKKKWNAEY